MEFSEGTFQIDPVRSVMANGDRIVAIIRIWAQRGGAVLSMDGVDLMRVEERLIREVWLFSGDRDAKDKFWDGTASAAHV